MDEFDYESFSLKGFIEPFLQAKESKTVFPSVAFASDAIPGKHWVVQVSRIHASSWFSLTTVFDTLLLKTLYLHIAKTVLMC